MRDPYQFRDSYETLNQYFKKEPPFQNKNNQHSKLSLGVLGGLVSKFF